MKPELVFDRDSALLVAPGLYVLRYESGGDKADPPTAVAHAAQGSEGAIEIISAPGCATGRLEHPGSALLVRANDYGTLQIGVTKRSSSGSLDAAFKLESVGSLLGGRKKDRGGDQSTAEQESPPASTLATGSSRVIPPNALFLAHVSRRGDVWVAPGEWAAGPEAPGRIEGLELRPLEREGVRAELQVRLASNPKWSDWIEVGAFAGSRGQNRALAGVRLKLTGEQAHRFIVSADALFLGSAIMSKRGREVECVSLSGRDPLVGFRFEVCPERRLSVRPPVPPPGRDAQPRVRVFRATAGG